MILRNVVVVVVLLLLLDIKIEIKQSITGLQKALTAVYLFTDLIPLEN